MKLAQHLVEKPWGRCALPPPFDAVAVQGTGQAKRIGEIWFEPVDGRILPLLVKYIFTSEKLSVQVHPNDVQARARGQKAGKNECWYILDAEPGAVLGLGTVKPLDEVELRAAAIDGSIEQLMDWKPVRPGEFYAVPAGTVHAIGAGISLVELQQNIDLTYRLYDYGRPRELHLDDGAAVSSARPYSAEQIMRIEPEGAAEQALAHFPQFDVVYSRSMTSSRSDRMDRAMWAVPLSGEISGGGEHARAGGCLYLAPGEAFDPVSDDATALLGFAA